MSALLVVTPLVAQENAATQKLMDQSKQFEEQIINVADNVYTAVGFSVSNVSKIVGDDGVVIVDTGMTRDDADRIAAEFRKISDKPVKAINKNDTAAKQIKADALAKLAGNMVNATARNYYLTVARELREETKPE